MRARSAWTAAMVCVLSATATAQDGLRSASFPERPAESTLVPVDDLFRVPPDFYNRRPDPRASRLFFRPRVPAQFVDPFPYLRPLTSRKRAAASAAPRGLPYTEPGSARETFLQPADAPGIALAPSRPGVPKTFYVIPGCYAGDKPPRREWLRPDCDMAALRIVPPV